MGDPPLLNGAFHEKVMLELVAASSTGAYKLCPGTLAQAKYWTFEATEYPIELIATILKP